MKAGRARLVAGNWKMNGTSAANQQLIEALKPALSAIPTVRTAICPPFPYLVQASALLSGSGVLLGAQDLSEQKSGAFTGEVSGAMLKDLGCHYVLVGHSERRQLHAESDALVAAKFQAAQSAGLVPILCLGETLAEREGGETEAVVARQLNSVMELTGVGALANAVLAYEPVWAIGTGRNASAEQAQQVHAFLRSRIAARNAAVSASMPILYGGSVKPGNAAELFAQPDVDGGLIGGASLVAEDFVAICRAASSA